MTQIPKVGTSYNRFRYSMYSIELDSLIKSD